MEQGRADGGDGERKPTGRRSAVDILLARPLQAPELLWRTVQFTGNYLFWRLAAGRRVSLGRNLHVLTTCCFHAERPHAHISVGDNFLAYRRCRICAWGEGRVAIGSFCSLGSGSNIHARASVTLGHCVLVSWDALIMDFDGHSLDPAQRARELQGARSLRCPPFAPLPAIRPDPAEPTHDAAPIVIADNVWLGARSIVLKGVTIGEGAIVAAGAVVTRDVPPHTLVAGNPAQAVRSLRSFAGHTPGRPP